MEVRMEELLKVSTAAKELKCTKTYVFARMRLNKNDPKFINHTKIDGMYFIPRKEVERIKNAI